MNILSKKEDKKEEKFQISKDYLIKYDELNEINDIDLLNLIPLPIKNIGKLFIGSLGSLNEIKNYNIGLIISLENPTIIYKNIEHIHYKIRDEMDDKSLQIFQNILPEAIILIHKNLTKNINVLVHCAAGVSRSSTLILSYLMKYHFNGSLINSLKYLKKCRPCVFPNFGFLKLLVNEDTS